MTTLQLPDTLADALRTEAEQGGATIPDLLAHLLNEHRRGAHSISVVQTDDALTQSLNTIYSTEDSTLHPGLTRLQILTIGREQW